MTPAARVSAAIECLDAILAGSAAEKVLTTWARQHRFAGSGDRAAIRDLVFGVLRRKRSCAWIGGGETGRALMIGALRLEGGDLGAVFSGERFAPAPLSAAEAGAGAPLEDAPFPVQVDCPEWIWPMMEASLGDKAGAVLAALRARAPVMLRVNLVKGGVEAAREALLRGGVETGVHPLSATALEVTANPRRVAQSGAFRDGLVELQDAASQAVVDRLLPYCRGRSVLDYCAGGGGKSLALAAGGAGRVTAHDAEARRMADIPVRAKRAGVEIDVAERPEGVFDMVFCDAPCSGTGAWRRQPDAKWRLDLDRLQALNAVQDEILEVAPGFVAEGGILAYATCSLLKVENEDRVQAFLNRCEDWEEIENHRFSPLDGGDGFFLSILRRKSFG